MQGAETGAMEDCCFRIIQQMPKRQLTFSSSRMSWLSKSLAAWALSSSRPSSGAWRDSFQ
jgi:hypothetical protein